MAKLLNIGAGNRILVGNEGDIVINHDIVAHREEINCVWDLNVTPWPWKNDEFDKIEFVAVVEHLAINPLESFNQCWRILKKGGILRVKYPLFSSPNFHDDMTHRWGMSEKSLDYLDPSTQYGKDYSFYTTMKWKILSRGVVKERNVVAELTPIK